MSPAGATAVATPTKKQGSKPQPKPAAKRQPARSKKQPVSNRTARNKAAQSKAAQTKAAQSKSTRRQTARRSSPASERLAPTAVAGLIWAGALLAGVVTSRYAAAAVVTPVGLVAAVSAARSASRQRRTGRPAALATTTAILLTLLVPAVALAGVGAAAGASVVAALVAATVSFFLIPRRRPWALLVALLGPAVACASVVAAADQGRNLALTLVAGVCVYDFACWLNGTRRGAGGFGGIAAGLVTLGVTALFVAGVFVPPFSGARPWIMFGMLGVLCPAGVVLAGRVAGSERLPALLRIDSLMLAGPAWVAGASLLLHR